MSAGFSRTTTEASLTTAGQSAGEGAVGVTAAAGNGDSSLMTQSSLSSTGTTGSASNSLTGTPIYCLRIRSRKGRILTSIKLCKSVMRIGRYVNTSSSSSYVCMYGCSNTFS